MRQKITRRTKKRGEHHLWKGGRYINDAGYYMVYSPEHPRAMKNGYVREHIVISEKAIGGILPNKCQVHHYGDKLDNSKIVICEDQHYHNMIHTRTDSLLYSGDVNRRKCKFCKEYDDIDNLYCKHLKTRSGWNVYHRGCRNKYEMQRKLNNTHAKNETCSK